MATRIPLVQVAGQVQQLQSGDTINVPQTGTDVVSQTNDEASPIVIGAPVYNDAADGVKKAKADASGTIKVLGLVQSTSISAGSSGIIAIGGVLVATTGQWDAITGGSGGLTFGTIYYVSAATAGLLTAIAPSTVGQYVAQVGIALSTTEMKITVEPTILL